MAAAHDKLTGLVRSTASAVFLVNLTVMLHNDSWMLFLYLNRICDLLPVKATHTVVSQCR